MTSSQEKLTPDFSEGVDRKLLNKVRDRFLQVNQARLERTRNALAQRQRDVIDILPLLYQVNHPLLPGFAGPDVPSGVTAYQPDRAILRLAKSFSQTFKFRADRRGGGDIHSLFAMGSSGTLAHSESSDVDLWLCHDPELSSEALAGLSRKAALIDRWAASQGLELHTFLMNARTFRAGEGQSELDAESSGSAQHFLLLDEFYRTAILLAGRYPLWWLIPPDMEGDHAVLAERLLSQRFVREREVIDFGTAFHIPLAELLGSSLWQLYKSLDAPYKSVLKLMLSEAYAQELPHKEVLSLQFKRLVYEDCLNIEVLDPYLMIYQRLESYLEQRGESKRLDLVRKSLYLKVNKKLTRHPKGHPSSWQRLLLQQLVADWGWPESKFAVLDARSDWKADQVMQERQELLAELTYSYRYIASYARMHNIASRMTSADLSYLGRKLYATFQRKAGKVERINPGIAPNLWEDSLAILHSSAPALQGMREGWMLYRDLGTPSEAAFQVPLKKSSSLIELLGWIYYNGLYTRATRLNLVPGTSGVTMHDVLGVLNALELAFPIPLPTLSDEAFRQVGHVERMLLVVNLGVDPFASVSDRGGHLISDRTDALDYSLERRNLVHTIDQVSLNSWHEMMANHFHRGETLIQLLHSFLQQCSEQLPHRPELSVVCFCPTRAETIARRVRDLFDEVYRAFFAGGRVLPVRFVVEVEDRFYVLSSEESSFRFTMLGSETELFESLARTSGRYSRILFDRFALPHERLMRAVLKHATPGQLQCYLAREPYGFRLILVDEVGNLLQHHLNPEDEIQLVASLWHYLLTVLGRQSLQHSLSLDAHPTLSFFQVTRSAGQHVFKRYAQIPQIDVHPVVVTASMEGSVLRCDLGFDRHEFSYYEYGERQCDALVHYLLHARDLPQRLPVKIVDAFLPEALDSLHPGSSHAADYLDLYLRLDQRIQLCLHQQAPDR